MRISDWSSDVCSSDLGIEGDTCQQVAIGGDLARLDAAADQHGVGFRGELKRLLTLDRDPVHGRDFGRGRGDMRRPALRLHAVHDRGCDERVQLVAAVLKSTRLNSSQYCASRMPSSY